jgi:hypothetical protein
MIYTINKGSHRSTWLPKFTFKTSLAFSFEFLSDPAYTLDNKADQGDTNKIFGISDSWHHHKHSVRIGWRYDSKLKKSIGCVYFYRDGKHFVEDLGAIEQNKPYICYIDISQNSYTVIALDKKVIIPRTSRWWGPRYLLFPYFGGQQVAPKQFNIEVNNW